MKRQRYEVDNLPMVRQAKAQEASQDKQAADFWKLHADYWGDRGNVVREGQCRSMQRQFARWG